MLKKGNLKLKKCIPWLRGKTKKQKYPINLKTDYKILRGYGIRDRVENKIDLAGVVNFHILNKVKEIELKQKIARGHKVRVAFYLDCAAKFTGANVYRAMLKDDLFEPFIVLYSIFNIKEEGHWQDHSRDLSSLLSRKFKVYDGYDEHRNFVPLENFKPDIVFNSAFYLDSSFQHLSGLYLNVNYLVCQLNYGFNVLNNYRYHYHNRLVNTAWKYFVETRVDFDELRKYALHYGTNAVFTGSPVLEEFNTPIEQCSLPAKIDNGKPVVIYAPHWTIKHTVNIHDLATFHLYKDYFFEMAKNNPDINFVFKPHPSLRYRLDTIEIMASTEYDDYVRQWDNLPNAISVHDDNYICLFRKSDLLITDSASFIFEWLPTEKPCLYLQNPVRNPDTYLEGFTKQAADILSTYYLCKNISEITKTFKTLMQGEDPKLAARIEICKKIFEKNYYASRNILNYLKDVLLN